MFACMDSFKKLNKTYENKKFNNRSWNFVS